MSDLRNLPAPVLERLASVVRTALEHRSPITVEGGT